MGFSFGSYLILPKRVTDLEHGSLIEFPGLDVLLSGDLVRDFSQCLMVNYVQLGLVQLINLERLPQQEFDNDHE